MPSYRANVTRVTGDGVFFRVPHLGVGYEFGPSPSPPGIVLAVDDPIVATTVSGAREDLVIVAGQGDGIALTPIELGDLPPIDFEDLANVVVTAPVPGQVVVWDGADWVNDDLPTYALNDLIDVTITTPVAAQTIRYNGSGWVNSLLTLDDLSGVVITSDAVGHVLQHNGTAWINQAVLDMVGASGADVITAKVTGDTQKRVIINAHGPIEWGSGAATPDVNLYRDSANVLKTDDALIVTGALTAATGQFGGTSGDAVYIGNDAKIVDVNVAHMLGVQSQSTPANGGIVFGSDADTNLYRVAANELKTDDMFLASNVFWSDPSWATPTLAAGWTNFGGGWSPARYRRLSNGVVQIEGLLTGPASPANIFTLPSGFRPSSHVMFAVIGDGTPARLDVLSDGSVNWAVGGSAGYFSITCSFYAN